MPAPTKAHTVKGDGVAEACAVRTHAACTSTLVALRPPLQVCEPFFKISRSWPSAVARLRVAAEGRRPSDAMRLSSSITSRAPIDSAAWAINPDHPSLNSTCGCPAPTAVPAFFCSGAEADLLGRWEGARSSNLLLPEGRATGNCRMYDHPVAQAATDVTSS